MHATIFLLFTLSITMLAVLHTTALIFSLYWVYLWLDIPMHILGGATVALGYQSRFMLGRFEETLTFGLCATIGAALTIGLLWEVYEFSVGPLLPGYVLDTAIDLSMDVVGAIIGYATARAVAKL
jgi:hypothetical protein